MSLKNVNLDKWSQKIEESIDAIGPNPESNIFKKAGRPKRDKLESRDALDAWSVKQGLALRLLSFRTENDLSEERTHADSI